MIETEDENVDDTKRILIKENFYSVINPWSIKNWYVLEGWIP